ncbi:MAG: LptF/LptG family permease [Bacteroidetes bacterium]|nr:LptF/LptG family permease [Bacteroidota bacterium]
MERHHGKTIHEQAVMKRRRLLPEDYSFLQTIDWYIIRKFLGTFFFSLLLLVFIIIVFDISEHIDDFLKHDAPLKAIVFDYYLNFIPDFVNLFSYLFVFIAVIFFTSRMASDTEIVAILSSGISFRRMLRPYFVAAIILALMSFLLGNFLIPYTNRGKLEFEKQYIKDKPKFNDMNIHKQVSPGVFLYMENFNIQTNKGWKFTLEKFSGRELVYKITAEEADWDSVRSKWHLNRYFSRSIGPMAEKIRKGIRLDTALGMKPADFTEDVEEVKTMNFFTLRKHIQMKKLRGDPDLIKFQVKGYERVAFPFATLVLTLIGVAVSSRKVRGGIGFNLGFGLAITFLYILFMQVFTVLATFGNFPPLLAVWTPNIIFGIIALILARLSPK